MSFKHLLYITLPLFSLFCSCSDNLNVDLLPDQESTTGETDERALSIIVEDPAIRTRDIGFATGSTVKINTVWIGVFDASTGDKVADQHTVQGFKPTTSGNPVDHIVRIDYDKLMSSKSDGTPSQLANNKDYIIVAIVNYRGVKGRKNPTDSNLDDLEQLLKEAKNWSEFNEIGIDTKTAYFDDDHSDDVPVMAGFFIDEKKYKSTQTTNTHIKINQFASGTGINLLPATLADNVTQPINALKVRFNTTGKNFYSFDKSNTTLDHRLYLRRLAANINVTITTDNPNLTISQVAYRRFNMPNTVYIMERTMLNPSKEWTASDAFPTEAALSPNFADYDEHENNGLKGYWNDDDALADLNPDEGKEEDKEVAAEAKKNWQYTDVSDDGSGVITFSFQHFANKHWARKEVVDYKAREALSDDYTFFPNLANDASDINNNASFFLIKMHIIDHSTNRCVETQYMIHEGYTSDENGYAIGTSLNNANSITGDQVKKRLRDFSTARNLDYHYDIHVKGIDNIFVNINPGLNAGSQALEHRADIGGRAWKMIYMNDPEGNNPKRATYDNGKFEGAIGKDGGLYQNAIEIAPIDNPNGSGLVFDTDMAFRLYGYDSDPGVMTVKGYNYNFPSQSFSWLNGMWPVSLVGAIYYQDYNALMDAYNGVNGSYPRIEEKLFKTFMFIDAEQFKDLRENDFENFDPVKDMGGQPQKDDKNYWMNIVQFIEHFNNLNVRTKYSPIIKEESKSKEEYTKKYHLYVSKREIDPVPLADKDNYIRAIYIGNRNGFVDTDGCSSLINIYTAVQDPPTK